MLVPHDLAVVAENQQLRGAAQGWLAASHGGKAARH
jgi:hypothetical protein